MNRAKSNPTKRNYFCIGGGHNLKYSDFVEKKWSTISRLNSFFILVTLFNFDNESYVFYA